MQRAGYRIIPVNPNETAVLGETASRSLDAIPEKVDIVDIFRRSEFVPETGGCGHPNRRQGGLDAGGRRPRGGRR